MTARQILFLYSDALTLCCNELIFIFIALGKQGMKPLFKKITLTL